MGMSWKEVGEKMINKIIEFLQLFQKKTKKPIKLVRLPSRNSTIGYLFDPNHQKLICVTLEPKWAYNQPFVSSIPPGLYKVKPHNSQKFGKTYEIQDVPNRTDILFHKGNVVDDTKGCILVGKEIGVKNYKLAVIDSTNGFKDFMDYFGSEEFDLEIINHT